MAAKLISFDLYEKPSNLITQNDPDNKNFHSLNANSIDRHIQFHYFTVASNLLKSLTSIFKKLRPNLLRFSYIQPIISDAGKHTGRHRILLCPQKAVQIEACLSPLELEKLNLNQIDWRNLQKTEIPLLITYEHFDMEQIVRWMFDDVNSNQNSKLDSNCDQKQQQMLAVSSFTLIGHIAQFNLRTELLPYKNVIGRLVIDKHANVRTALNKLREIDTQFRTFAFELIGGEPDYVTTIVEHHCKFRLDFSTVYWNSRLSTEHSLIVKQIQNATVASSSPSSASSPAAATSRLLVFDCFAGIGPFSIPVFRAAPHHIRVFANDLNPECVRWLRTNIDLNFSSQSWRKLLRSILHSDVEANGDTADTTAHACIITTQLDAANFLEEVLPRELVRATADAATNKEVEKEEVGELQEMECRAFLLMNLPAIALEFLPVLRRALSSYLIAFTAASSPPPIKSRGFRDWRVSVRCYCFIKKDVKGNEKEEATTCDTNKEERDGEDKVSANQQSVRKFISDLFPPANLVTPTSPDIQQPPINIRFVRNVAPTKEMFCVEFDLRIRVELSLHERDQLKPTANHQSADRVDKADGANPPKIAKLEETSLTE